MSVESKNSEIVYVPEIDLVTCPVVDLCQLPKHNFLCKFPACKVLCSEYLAKVKDLKRR